MPFGAINLPALFQHLMQRVLNGMQSDNGKVFVSAYLDDVIVFSDSLQDHVSHLRAVFNRLKEAGLRLNPKISKFVCNEVDYLDHLVTLLGLKPHKSKFGCCK